MTKFREGNRVQYVGGGKHRPTGQITEVQPEVRASGEVITDERCKVRWDDTQQESDWIPASLLIRE